MRDSIDVVIVAYNRYELTRSCLQHLAAQTAEHRVIVVDNGSTDDTRALVRSEWPDVHVECFDANQSFPKACNRGVAAGGGEAVVLLNNDVDCRPDFLERLVTPLREDAMVGSVASLVLQRDGKLIDSVGLTADATLSSFARLRGLTPEHAGRSYPDLLGPGGGCAAYRRSAWEQVGGLDEALLFYMEDVDLALRLRAGGWRSVAEPKAVGIHLGSATLGHRSASQRHYAGFGRGYLLRKYGLLRGRAALRTLVTEALVVLADMAISRDLAGLRGRIHGWGKGHLRGQLTLPPQAIDRSISFRDALAWRWQMYASRGT